MLSVKPVNLKLVFALICICFFLSRVASAASVPSTIGDDFQDTVEINHPVRSMRVGDFYHVTDVHGQQIGLIRISKFTSKVCIARVIEGLAPMGSGIIADTQMTADRNTRFHARHIASVDEGADNVGAKRPNEESAAQVRSLDGTESGWRTWTPIKGIPMRKMVYLGISPSTAYVSDSSQAGVKANLGYTGGIALEFMKERMGIETGLDVFQSGFNQSAFGEKESLSLTYLGIPILLKYAVLEHQDWDLRLKGGLTEAFLVSQNVTTSGVGASSTSSSTGVKSMDTLLTIGTDVVIPGGDPESLNYWAQLSFSYGLTNINSGEVASGTVINEVLNLSGGIYF